MIRFNEVWKRYGKHEALRGLSFTVPAGSAYALIGANGAGKTTTIKTLMNIIEPTRGSVKVLDVDSRSLSPAQLSQIGYVSESQDMPSRLTVGQYFDYLRPFYTAWDKDLEQSLRLQLRLPADRKIGHLSHGMRMKMGLACALPFHPKLLVLDEPFSGLDPLVREEFMEEMLSQAGEMTVLLSSHELSEIEGVTSHVGFIDEGRLIFEEPMQDLSDRFRQVRVTLEQEAAVPAETPKNWLHTRTLGTVLTFVDTNFSEDRLGERLRAHMAGVRRIEAEPMTLRSIFTALARAARDGGL